MKCLRCVAIFHCEQNVGKVDRIMDCGSEKYLRIMDCGSEKYLWSRSMVDIWQDENRILDWWAHKSIGKKYGTEVYWTGGPKILDMRTTNKILNRRTEECWGAGHQNNRQEAQNLLDRIWAEWVLDMPAEYRIYWVGLQNTKIRFLKDSISWYLCCLQNDHVDKFCEIL